MEKTIQEKAMLVDLKVHCWTGQMKDRLVTDEVTSTKKSEKDSGSWVTYLIPKKRIEKVTYEALKIRSHFYTKTLPWMDGGARILPSALFLDFTQKTREKIENFNRAVDDFINDYPELVEKSKERLGDLASTITYPSPQEIKGKFRVKIVTFPMPTSQDFRVDLGEESHAIKDEMEKDIQERLQAATNHLWTGLKQLVEKIAVTMEDPDKKFKDATVNNLKCFVDDLPKMNITDDPNMKLITKNIQDTLAKLIPTSLRDDKTYREKAAKDANDILSKIKTYM